MRIYLIRHGDPDYSTDSLTEAGKAEALSLSEYLASIKLDYLFTSPLGRARATASYTETRLAKEATVLDWTEEIKLPSPDGSDLDFMTWYQSPENFRNQSYKKNDAWNEILQNITKESDSLIESLGWKRSGHQYHFLSEKNIHKDVQIAIFSHGGFGLTWLAYLLNIPYHYIWSSFFLHASSITTILFDERPQNVGTPRVIGLAALPHLYKNGLTPTRTGIQSNYL
jgi:broad specificity phosphatase PhoE